MVDVEKLGRPVYAVVMAGGQGTRLWPLSRRSHPKQFLALGAGGRTLLQDSVRRAAEVVGGIGRVLVAAPVEQAHLVRQQLPELPPHNLVLEPVGRNTAACISLVALHIQSLDPAAAQQAVMAVFPADHLFVDERPWIEAVQAAIAFAVHHPRLVTIGIPPSSPSSNYGYLHLGENLGRQDEHPVFEVREFVEKPDAQTAQQYLASGEYLWNTGTFAWQVQEFQRALKQHLPHMYDSLSAAARGERSLEDVYPQLENISVDFGVMERSTNVAVVQSNFQRIDVGTLASLNQIWPEDKQENTVNEASILAAKDSRRNITFSDQGVLALIGVEDMIIIRAGDVVLVCPKARAGEVKELVAMLEERRQEHYQ